MLVEAGAVRLMIDFGHLAPLRLEELGFPLERLTHVAISHIHADHIGGLEELAFLTRFVQRRKIQLLIPSGLSGLLWEHSLRGGLEMVADGQGQAEHCSLESYFEIEELHEGWNNIGPIALRAFPTDHVPGKDSWGFVVREQDSDDRMIFGCDTRTPHRQLLADQLDDDFARGPIFHDCQLGDGGAATIHVSLAEIDYPPAVQDRIVLVPDIDAVDEYRDRIRAAGLRIAHPGDTFKMPDWRSCLS